MESTSSDQAELVRTIGFPIQQAKGWLKLLGGLSIVYGVFTALSIIGIVVAWLPIWMGVLLYQAAGLADEAYRNGDSRQLTESLAKLKTYFTITGVLALLGLLAVAALFAFGFLGAILGAITQR